MSPTLIAQLRQMWEAVDNAWNQRILNFTQSRQLDLLRSLGFDNPDWRDLGRLLAALIAALALLAAGWTLWERRQHDPWLRLLARAHARLAAAGAALPPQAPPRELARHLPALTGLAPADAERLRAWLLALEHWRYAPPAPGTPAARRGLATLQRQFRTLPWPARA